MSGGTVVREARAKANLRLRVLARERSGYHSIETIYLRLGLADRVELEAGGRGVRLEVTGPAADRVPEGAENLSWIAAEEFFRASAATPRLSIRLEKRVPAGAGLGGGSADAAAVLSGLNELSADPLPADRLLEIAGGLGSDVPFALADLPMALGWGRGRRLLPLAAPGPRPAVVALPDLHVATPEAYAWLDRDRGAAEEKPEEGRPGSAGSDPGAARLPEPGRLAGWEGLLAAAGNDFEPPVFRRHPEIRRLKEALAEEGARPALLCGSGSAVIGLFASEERRDEAAARLEEEGVHRVIRARTPV